MPPRRKPLPTPLPEGYTLTDTEKKPWKLGKIIGRGGFGLIYLASRRLDAPVPDDSDFVIKIEYHENGPLFSELKFYQRAAKPESIQRWKKGRGLDFLGIPSYFGSGLAEFNGTRYRFMVMDRLGTDLQKVCGENRGRLKRPTVLRLGCLLLDILEYIHDNEYVHADIKAANLLLGHGDPSKVYLADYGLSYRYCPDGVHKEYKENPKKGHNGTIEYTSADAHNGVAPSRRGDLEVLGYCLLHWLCGRLPWDTALKKPAMVQEAKARLMAHLPDSVTELSPSGTSTVEVARFLLYTKSLGYKERPDYQKLRDILAEGRSKAARRDGPLDLSRPMEEELGCGTPPYSKPMRAKPTAKETARRCEAAGTPDGAEPPSRAPVHQRAKTQPRPSPAQEEVKAKPAGVHSGTQKKRQTRPQPKRAVRGAQAYDEDWMEEEESSKEPHPEEGASPQHTYSLRERPARRQDAPWGLKQWGGAFTILFFLILVVLLVLGPQTSRRESMARL